MQQGAAWKVERIEHMSRCSVVAKFLWRCPIDSAVSFTIVHVPAATVDAPTPTVELPFPSASASREASQVMAATVRWRRHQRRRLHYLV